MLWYSKCVVMMPLSGVVRRVLHRAEVLHLHVLGDDHQASPGCWPVVRLTPTRPMARRPSSALGDRAARAPRGI